MTDNEKRAHDLATAIVSSLMAPEFLQGAAQDQEDGVKFDVYQKYMELYKSALNSFDRDFPDGK